MSYNVDVIEPPFPNSYSGFLDFLSDWEESGRGGSPGETMLGLYRALEPKFPCILIDPDGPWSDGPLLNNFMSPVSVLGISHSRAAEVMPVLIQLANARGLAVFDPQDEVIHVPTGKQIRADQASAQPPNQRRWWRFW